MTKQNYLKNPPRPHAKYKKNNGCVAIDNLETKSHISQIRSLPDEIYRWVRAGFQYCLFLAQMVGEPAPTISKNITDIVGCVAIDNLETKSQISQRRTLPD